MAEQQVAPDPVKARRELHQGLIDLEWYSKSGHEFDQQFLDPQARNELYQGLVKEKMYSKGFDEFSEQFFGDLLKKKEEPAPYTFQGQLDLSQPLSNQLQGGSGNIPKEYQKDYLQPLTYKPEESVAIGSPTPSSSPLEDDSEAEKFLTEADKRDFEKLQRETDSGKLTGVTNPVAPGLMNAPAPIMLSADIDKNAKAVITRFQEEITGKYEPQGTVKDITEDLKQVAPSFNKAVISAASSLPKGYAIVVKGISDLVGIETGKIEDWEGYKLGQIIEEGAKKIGLSAIDEKRAGFFNSTVPSAFGSMIGMLLTGGPRPGVGQLGKAPGFLAENAGVMFSGAIQTAVPEYEAAKQAGKSDEEAFKVFFMNLPGGASEAWPIASMFGRLNKITGGGVVNALKHMGAQGFEEGSQEAVQQYISNKVASFTYDPKRDLKQGLLEGASAGFIVGFLMPGVIGAMGKMTPEDQAETQQILREALKTKGPEVTVKSPQGDLGKQPTTKTTPSEKPKEPTPKTGGPAAVPEVKEEEKLPVQGVEEKQREELISQLEASNQRMVDKYGDDWTNSDHSKNLNKKLDALKSGKPFSVTDVTGKLIEEVGKSIATFQSGVGRDPIKSGKKQGEQEVKGEKGLNEEENKIRENIKALPDMDFNDDEANKNWKEVQDRKNRLLSDDSYLREQIKAVKEGKEANQSVYESMFQLGLTGKPEETKSEQVAPETEPVTQDVTPDTVEEKPKYVPKDGWDKNLIKAREYAQALGIDTKGKYLDDLVDEINGKTKPKKEVNDRLSDREKYKPNEELSEYDYEKQKWVYGEAARQSKIKLRKGTIEALQGPNAKEYIASQPSPQNKYTVEQALQNEKAELLDLESMGVLKTNKVPSDWKSSFDKSESKAQADKIAQDSGFDNASHLINSVKKRTGQEFESVQDIPKELINRVANERNLEELPPAKENEVTHRTPDQVEKIVSTRIPANKKGQTVKVRSIRNGKEENVEMDAETALADFRTRAGIKKAKNGKTPMEELIDCLKGKK